jgi:hypothetical protein
MGYHPPMQGNQADAPLQFPSRVQVRAVLQGLVEGRITPEQANNWACPWVMDGSSHPDRMDEAVWKGLQQLCGADMPASPDEPLYHEVDFRAWLEEFDRLTSSLLDR